MEYNKRLYDALTSYETKFIELNKLLETNSVNVNQMIDINVQLSKITDVVLKFREYKKIIKECIENEEYLKTGNDKEMIKLIESEYFVAKDSIPKIERELQILLLPKDPYDNKNVIIEMRPAAGGDESSIFTADLFETYKNYASSQGWKIKIMDISINAFGYDYVYFSIVGKNVYSKLKFESGVHRVQRIPKTESKGRVHTSTITVAVMPELDEVDFKLNPVDIRTDVYRSGGAGGQHVNRTESAVRLTHLPTGIVVACDTERSQIENRANAMKMLIAKIWNKMEEDRMNTIANMRKEQVGTGERSEKIRTYNYPQNRVTDHRIGLSLNKLDTIMTGDLEEIINALITNHETELLKNLKI